VVGDNDSVNTYPGDDPQQPDSEQPVDDTPADGPADEPADTELTQPVGYWERQAAELAREQQAPPHPTTPYSQGGPVFNPAPGQHSPGFEQGQGHESALGSPPQGGESPYAQPNPYPYGPQNPYGPYSPQPYGGRPTTPHPPGQPAPYVPPRGVAPYQPPYSGPVLPDHAQSTMALVLGLVGLIGGFFLCGVAWLVSPFAWAVGSSALKDIRASQGQVGGEGKAQAGMVLGIIGTVLLILALLFVIGFVVLLVAADTSSTGSSI